MECRQPRLLDQKYQLAVDSEELSEELVWPGPIDQRQKLPQHFVESADVQPRPHSYLGEEEQQD